MSKETIKLFDFLSVFGATASESKYHEFIRNFFYEANAGNYEDTPYKYITEFEQRGDGSGYETFFIFERKSDKKLFYYYIYDGRIEVDHLCETSKVVTTKWDFEKVY